MPPRRLIPALFATLLAACVGESAPPAAATKEKAEVDRAEPPPKAAPDGAKSEAPVADLLAAGLRASESGDLAAAVRSFELVLASDPTNRQALFNLARTSRRQAIELPRPQSSPYHLRAGSFFRRLIEAYPTLTAEESALTQAVLYDEACTLAINGETARAVGALAVAIESGYTDLAHMEIDSELDTLRRLPEFRFLMRRLERRLVLERLAASKPFTFRPLLNDTDGKPVALADFRGKVVAVALCATWASPCRKEAPHLVELERRYRGKGLDVVGVFDENADEAQARKSVAAFAKDLGINFPCLIADEGALRQAPGLVGYPTILLIDRSGKVRLKLDGYQPLSTLDTAASVLLGEVPGPDPKKTAAVP